MIDILYFYAQGIYCIRQNHFFGNNSVWNEILQRDRVTWHAPLQTFGDLRQAAAKWRRKSAFCEFFVTETTHRFTHFPADDFREILTQNVNRCGHENFWNRISKFFQKGSFSEKKNLIFGFLGVHLRHARCSLAFRPTANLSIAPYSRRARNACIPSDFFSYALPFSRYRDISGTSRNVAMHISNAAIRVGSLQIDFIFGNLVGSMTLTYFCNIDVRLNENLRNQDLRALGQFRFARPRLRLWVCSQSKHCTLQPKCQGCSLCLTLFHTTYSFRDIGVQIFP